MANNAPRSLTRTSEERRTQIRNYILKEEGSLLSVPEHLKKPGYQYGWVAKSIAGEMKPFLLEDARCRGWEVSPIEEMAEMAPSSFGGRPPTDISVKELLLVQREEEFQQLEQDRATAHIQKILSTVPQSSSFINDQFMPGRVIANTTQFKQPFSPSQMAAYNAAR